ncbi:MAG TPA: hypothetical protein VIC56_10350 [Gemmatimonadota bacterium]
MSRTPALQAGPARRRRTAGVARAGGPRRVSRRAALGPVALDLAA